MSFINGLQGDAASHKRFRSIAALEPQEDAEQPKPKKAKSNVTCQQIFMKSFAFFEDVGALLQLSRVSKTFRLAVKQYYDQFPSFGTEEEIFNRLVFPVFETQRLGHHSKARSDDVVRLSNFATKYIKKLLPHQRVTARASNLCPRTIRVFGERGYALFNRCQSQGDRSLSEGSGAVFKKVELCYPLWTEEVCTWKTIRCKKDDARALIVAKQEIEMAKLAKGASNVEQTYDICLFNSKKEGKPQKLGMIGPFYNCGDLFNFSQNVDDEIEEWSVIEILKVARDIANGVAELHTRNIVHRDLKAENIMIHRLPSKELQAIVIDLGGASLLHDKQKLGSIHSTTQDSYSPELCQAYDEQKPLPCSFASDIWALGRIFYQMMNNDELYYIDEDSCVTIDNINDLDIVELPVPTADDPAAYHYCYPLLTRLFKMTPQERPTVRDIVKWLDQLILQARSSLGYS